MDIYIGILVTFLAILILYGIKRMEGNKELGIIDKEQANIVRAICALVVILVHVPQSHGNVIQDAIGSFGYVAVTIFFMLSAYGLKYSVENKENYLKNFWKNRILVLLIPLWITNIMLVIVSPGETIIKSILTIIGINNVSFVTVLLGYYVIFWLVYRFIKNDKIKDWILCIIVLMYSVLGKIMNLTTGWQVESIGLILGILIYYIAPRLKNNKNELLFLTLISSVILGILYIKCKNLYMIGTWCLKTLLSISLVLLLTFMLNRIKIGNKMLQYIGSISYEIYLLHTTCMTIIYDIRLPSGLWIILAILLTIFIASLVKFIDSKIIKFIKGKVCNTNI